MKYSIVISRDAEKYLSKLSGKIYNSIVSSILDLADNPRPTGCTDLKGFTNTYRIRCGDYRVVYEIVDDNIYIEVLDIGPRGQIYDKW